MIWFTEYWTENVGLTVKADQVKKIRSKYQEILVLDTPQFGKMLILDGLVQTTEKDEFIYHEMLAHPALLMHPNPERVLVIGGGDGGTVREVLKHSSVKEVHLCEIDEEVILISEKYFPSISEKLRDPKVKIFIEDGNEFLQERQNYYDVIIMDSSDPVGASEVLFREEFYRKVKSSLRHDGIMVAQTESPVLQEEYFSKAYREIRKVFRNVGVYLAYIPTYPSGMWSFTIASDFIDITDTTRNIEKVKELKTKYFCDSIYACLFSLPRFVQDILKKS
ncbi:MAG TPA: polyamine aminopropyltransferase [Persephonella sp.]|uniref:Polyamine aminopropyltransferase n=1 Tax=Persephonella marina (strain DSM 14350 / EX-H1) TaxID=123214 RepID=C0QRB0_PERMH|nr:MULTISPECIES: polyamine aminopropyltransferase [Persephonella]ACO04173.1 spermidine synthase [Persephonella marina EX-H1]HCB68953.1 polyamine aminopropyltransferase [Persephonella sp.]